MTDLVRMLEAVEPRGTKPPPTVAELRRILSERRRQRRRRAMGVTMGALAAAAVVAVAVDGSQGHYGVIDSGPAAGLDSNVPDGAAGNAEVEWSMLLPEGEWTPVALRSSPVAPAGLTTGTGFWAADAARWPFGSVVNAEFNPGVAAADYADGSTLADDATTPAGTEVLVGRDDEPHALQMLTDVEGGSISLYATGVDERDLLALIDELNVDGDAVVGPGRPLPGDLEEVDPPPSERELRTTVAVTRSTGESIEVEKLPASAWHEVLDARRQDPGATVVERNGRTTLFYDADEGNPAGAMVATPGAIYGLSLTGDRGQPDPVADGGSLDNGASTDNSTAPSPTVPTSGPDDLVDAVDAMVEWTSTALIDELGLRPRDEVYAEWLADTPLPPDPGLDWLTTGPPLDPEYEVAEAHLLFACAWVEHWVATGNTIDLTQLAGDSKWPTARLLNEIHGGNDKKLRDMNPLNQVDSGEMRGLANARARAQSKLSQECTVPLGRR